MSDSVVNAGFEDVLSSVKRLVDEDGRKPVGGDKSAPRKAGRLVLTEALRVGDTSGTKEVPKAEGKPAPLMLQPVYRAENMSKPAANEDKQHEEAASVSSSADAAEPAVGLSAKIAALEAAIARTEDQWEPDGDSNDAYSGTRTQALPWSAEQAFEMSEQTETQSDAELVLDADPEADSHAASETKATFVRRPDRSADTRSPSPEPAAEDIAGSDVPNSVSIGRQELEALISEIVRQELQGALGERITRNLRKMVRREIHRALASRNLD